MAKHDWTKLKAAYVEGIEDATGRHYPTYADIADKFGIGVGYLKVQASKDNWTTAREHFQAEIERARQKNYGATIAAAGAEFDTRCLRTAKAQLRINRGLMGKLIHEARKPDADMDKLTLWMQRLSTSLARIYRVGAMAIGSSGDDGLEDWVPESPEALSFVRVPRAANAVIDADAA